MSENEFLKTAREFLDNARDWAGSLAGDENHPLRPAYLQGNAAGDARTFTMGEDCGEDADGDPEYRVEVIVRLIPVEKHVAP